jgi:hypothetical protein
MDKIDASDRIQEYRKRLYTGQCLLNNNNYDKWLEMKKLSTNIELLLTEISKEMINCRRKRNFTLKYHELIAEVESAVTNFEHYILVYVLSYG